MLQSLFWIIDGGRFAAGIRKTFCNMNNLRRRFWRCKAVVDAAGPFGGRVAD